jgi:catechol-2,3-dioxygenase
MSVIRFAHYNLRAPRPLLEQLRNFYVQVVGLHVGERPAFDKFGYWLYADGEPVLHLVESVAAVAPDARSSFSHAAFDCNDLEQTEHLLTRLGVPFRRGQVPETGEPQLFLADPAGNGVELIFASSDRKGADPDTSQPYVMWAGTPYQHLMAPAK